MQQQGTKPDILPNLVEEINRAHALAEQHLRGAVAEAIR
jgi:hypothetical protein